MYDFDSARRFYRGKKVFVTGHTGFKGSWLCRILTLAGAHVTGYALDPPTDPSLFDTVCLDDTIESVKGDIRDREHLMEVFEKTRPEIVIHMAAQPIVRESYKDPVATYETNVMGTVNVLECVRLCPDVRSFLNVTTDKVYDNRDRDYAYRETDPLDGYDPYSNSKSCSELVTHCYRKSFFEDGRCAISTARAGNVIGGGDFATDRLIPDCVRAVAAGRDIVIRNPLSVRPFQHVLDPLFAYLMIAEGQEENGELADAYNVGPDESDCRTSGEIADLFCEDWGDGVSWIARNDGGPHEAAFLKLDCTHLKETFGWEPVWHIETTVLKTVDLYRSYLAGDDVLPVMDRQIEEFGPDRGERL